MSVLLVILSACTNTPSTSPPQSTPATQEGPIRVQMGEGGPVPNPIASEELLAVYPDLSLLAEMPQAAVVGVLNLVSAPCAPCDDSLAVCALAPPEGCENVPHLVARAVEVAAQGGDPDVIRDAVTYNDDWVSDDTRARTGSVDVEVWIDPSSPATSETLARMSAITTALDEIPVQFHLRVLWDAEEDDEWPAALALLAAEEQSSGRAFLKEPAGAIPDSVRFEARKNEETLGDSLRAEQAIARAKGVRSTPTWFVEGYRLRGLQGEQNISHFITLSWMDLKVASSAQEPETP
ncbi:MAG: hypothetical protein P8R54_21150 [Myxococcota bacterium]|nr:hypothetical protein [Myxococcota bacterium]